MGNVARKHAVDAHLDAGMFFAEFGEGREQSVDGAFVHAEREFASLQALQFGEPLFDFIAEVNQALRVVLQKRSRIGEADRPGATNEERLAKRVLELADSEADGGLGAIKALPCAGKAAFFRHHQKYLQFTEVQEPLLPLV